MDIVENNGGVSPSCGSRSSESFQENNQTCSSNGQLADCTRLSDCDIAPSCDGNSNISESENSYASPISNDDVTIDLEVGDCDDTIKGVVTSQTLVPKVEMQTNFDGTTTVNALYMKHSLTNSTSSICTCPTQSTLTDFCRICHCEGDAELGPLIAPCYCRGSLRYVHQACLQQWIKSSDSKNCELCGYHFVMDSKLKPFHKWKKLSMSTAERRKIMCSVMFHIIAITCVIWSLYVLIEKTASEIHTGHLQWPFWTKLVVVAIGFTGGLVFMYVQCKVYVQLWKRLKAFNRVIYVKNNSPSGTNSPEEVSTPDTAEPVNVAESIGSLSTSEQIQQSGTAVADSNRK